jgi:signal recognition particle GTPase
MKNTWISTNTSMIENFKTMESSLEKYTDNFSKNLETEWKTINTSMITNFSTMKSCLEEYAKNFSEKFVESFSAILNHVGSLKKNLNDDTLKHLANEMVVTEVERITVTMTKSLEAIYKNMEKWQDDITKNIKADIEKKIKENSRNELETSIRSFGDDLKILSNNLGIVIENTKPRNIIRIIKDLLGIG